MTEALGVAVVGVGRWGMTLLRVLGQLGSCQVHCIFDGGQGVAEQAALNYPGLRVAATLDHLLAMPNVQAVLVATPPESHGPIARQVLEAGKHVFVEKPMATSLADALALERIARKNSCLAMAGHLLRYHAGVAALRALILQGRLGPIDWVVSRRIGWRAADRCGPWWSLAPHDLSVLRGALGSEPEQIAAAAYLPTISNRNPVLKALTGASQPPPSVRCPVRIVAAASFPQNISALIDVGLLDESKMRRVILIGRRAIAKFEDGSRRWPVDSPPATSARSGATAVTRTAADLRCSQPLLGNRRSCHQGRRLDGARVKLARRAADRAAAIRRCLPKPPAG